MRADPDRMKAKDVDEYLASVPGREREVLERLREAIRAAAPGAEERISYGMPGYFYRGPLVYFGAFKGHLSLFAAGRANLETFMDELGDHEIAGTTIHFSADRPLPDDLVERIVRARVRENEARVTRKSASVPGARASVPADEKEVDPI